MADSGEAPHHGAAAFSMMTASGERPVPAPFAPDLAAHRAVLARLLEVELARLDVALQIERERSMVFPETTIIVKDIQRLSAAVHGAAMTPAAMGLPVRERGGDDTGDGLDAGGAGDAVLLEAEAEGDVAGLLEDGEEIDVDALLTSRREAT